MHCPQKPRMNPYKMETDWVKMCADQNIVCLILFVLQLYRKILCDYKGKAVRFYRFEYLLHHVGEVEQIRDFR